MKRTFSTPDENGIKLLEGLLTVILVNARHVKAVPGRKTDVKDCEWLADLLRHGLLKASFIPLLHIRELRELTRYRQTLVKEQTAVANRMQKLIERALVQELMRGHNQPYAQTRLRLFIFIQTPTLRFFNHRSLRPLLHHLQTQLPRPPRYDGRTRCRYGSYNDPQMGPALCP